MTMLPDRYRLRDGPQRCVSGRFSTQVCAHASVHSLAAEAWFPHGPFMAAVELFCVGG